MHSRPQKYMSTSGQFHDPAALPSQKELLVVFSLDREAGVNLTRRIQAADINSVDVFMSHRISVQDDNHCN
jgi:hypothetical protein